MPVRQAFIAELPREIKLADGWVWEPVPRGGATDDPLVLGLRHPRRQLNIVITATESGPTVRIWCRGSAADEHTRLYTWEEPDMLRQLVDWMNRLNLIWGHVSDHWDELVLGSVGDDDE